GFKVLRPSVLVFGIAMPLIGGTLGAGLGTLMGLSLGGTTLFAVLCASASYIAVPAAMRLALPKANPALYVSLSLGVTFPFNVVIGIPTYFALAERFAR
ncbi:MAG: sodium-dependent bicarbonate transport family permease, partial [Alphaproteobacteria bacterium]